jgi:hypothetical protein
MRVRLSTALARLSPTSFSLSPTLRDEATSRPFQSILLGCSSFGRCCSTGLIAGGAAQSESPPGDRHQVDPHRRFGTDLQNN